MNLSDMSLSELFEESDRVGDKYLSPEEVASRDAQLQAARAKLTLLFESDRVPVGSYFYLTINHKRVGSKMRKISKTQYETPTGSRLRVSNTYNTWVLLAN